jgi:hypothetical protein
MESGARSVAGVQTATRWARRPELLLGLYEGLLVAGAAGLLLSAQIEQGVHSQPELDEQYG